MVYLVKAMACEKDYMPCNIFLKFYKFSMLDPDKHTLFSIALELRFFRSLAIFSL